jgi:hypothetical protein
MATIQIRGGDLKYKLCVRGAFCVLGLLWVFAMALLGDDLRPLIEDSVSRYEGNGKFAKGDASE